MRRANTAWLLVLLAAGCDGALPAEDAGQVDDAGPGSDGGPSDRTAPTITAALPADGSDGVERATELEATFSEPVRLGGVRVRVEGENVEAGVAIEDEARLVIEPPGGAWPAASEVEIRIDDDFEDLAGNALDRPYVFRFVTEDDVAPAVASSEPAEGAAGVSSRLGVIRVRFTKPMDQGAGSIALEGGAGTIGAPAWSPFEVSFPVSGLANDTSYRAVLSGFRDRSGNALDPAPVLGDGAIDFTTRGDDERPRVVSSTPFEGQVDVLADSLAAIEVRFDEAMDTSIVSAPLAVDATTTDVVITWTDDRTARFDVGVAVTTDAPHSLDLRGLRDVAGNALDGEASLVDGRLDFTTGIDAFVPYVALTTPSEGATNVALPLSEVALAFSEAMDTTITDVTVTDDLARTSTVTGEWRAAGTLLVLPSAAFPPGRTFDVDLSMLRDLSGTAVSIAHPYLGDGTLDFSLARPTGASCEQPLLLENANSIAGGRYTFAIPVAQRTNINGSAWCDDDGPADGLDSVVLYRKTTPALSDPSGTGRALRILTTDVSNGANIEVLRGICDPRDPAAVAARVLCATGNDDWDQLLDLPAGDYYIWLSTSGISAFGLDFSIEEVAAFPEGEGCEDPYDTTSATYTAPAVAGAPHVWTLPAGPNLSVDIAYSNAPSVGISCRDPGSEGRGDVVVAFDKAASDSVLDVRFRGIGGTGTAEVITGACRADDPAAVRAGCVPSIVTTASRRISVEGPAGPTHFWMAGTDRSNPFRGASLEIRELPAPSAAGSSCATAIPIVPGASVPVTADHAERYFAPSCMPVDSNVTWYSFDTAEELTQVRTTGAGGVALVHGGASRREAGCSTNATSTPIAVFAPVGTRVCVAVESGSAVSALAIESIDYAGVGTTAPTRLFIDPPNVEGTTWVSSGITPGDTWLALTPTRIWQQLGTAYLYGASRAGGTAAVARFEVDGRMIGDDGRAFGEELWSLDLTGAGRLFRFTDASGAWAPVFWDRGATYARNTSTFTIDGDSIYVADIGASSPRLSNLYRLSRTAPGVPVIVGQVAVSGMTNLVADDTWLYFSATDGATGLFRARKDAFTDPAVVVTPERIASFTALTAVRPDALVSPRYLYVRDANGDIHVIESPGGATPRVLGRIYDSNHPVDDAMDFDPATGTLVFFSTDEDPFGDWHRFGPP